MRFVSFLASSAVFVAANQSADTTSLLSRFTAETDSLVKTSEDHLAYFTQLFSSKDAFVKSSTERIASWYKFFSDKDGLVKLSKEKLAHLYKVLTDKTAFSQAALSTTNAGLNLVKNSPLQTVMVAILISFSYLGLSNAGNSHVKLFGHVMWWPALYMLVMSIVSKYPENTPASWTELLNNNFKFGMKFPSISAFIKPSPELLSLINIQINAFKDNPTTVPAALGLGYLGRQCFFAVSGNFEKAATLVAMVALSYALRLPIVDSISNHPSTADSLTDIVTGVKTQVNETRKYLSATLALMRNKKYMQHKLSKVFTNLKDVVKHPYGFHLLFLATVLQMAQTDLFVVPLALAVLAAGAGVVEQTQRISFATTQTAAYLVVDLLRFTLVLLGGAPMVSIPAGLWLIKEEQGLRKMNVFLVKYFGTKIRAIVAGLLLFVVSLFSNSLLLPTALVAVYVGYQDWYKWSKTAKRNHSLQTMKIKDLKKILTDMHLSCDDCVERSDLVDKILRNTRR